MDEEQKPDYTFNFDEMQTTDKIVSMFQDGNFIVAQTDKGITFRHRIPVNKVLNKNTSGDWILQELNLQA